MEANFAGSVHLPAPLAVAVEIRLLDAGTRVERVWRVSAAIGEPGLRLANPVPFAPKRPVTVTLRFPDDDAPFVAHGTIATERRPAARESEDGPDNEPRATLVAFTSIDPGAKARLMNYLEERMSTS